MTCINCDVNVTDCACSDIEDRLRNIIATGNSLSREWARRALYVRLAKKKLTQTVTAWAQNKEWAKHAHLN